MVRRLRGGALASGRRARASAVGGEPPCAAGVQRRCERLRRRRESHRRPRVVPGERTARRAVWSAALRLSDRQHGHRSPARRGAPRAPRAELRTRRQPVLPPDLPGRRRRGLPRLEEPRPLAACIAGLRGALLTRALPLLSGRGASVPVRVLRGTGGRVPHAEGPRGGAAPGRVEEPADVGHRCSVRGRRDRRSLLRSVRSCFS